MSALGLHEHTNILQFNCLIRGMTNTCINISIQDNLKPFCAGFKAKKYKYSLSTLEIQDIIIQNKFSYLVQIIMTLLKGCLDFYSPCQCLYQWLIQRGA